MEYMRADFILRQLLEERKTITDFLDAVFGFLKRNTDFYHLQANANDKIGFPRGIKEQIVLSCLQKYDPECKAHQMAVNDVNVPPAVEEEIEITTTTEHTVANEDAILNGNKKQEENVVIFTDMDYKNGAMFDNYCWSQTMEEIELYVKVPVGVKSSKDVKIELKPNSIRIKSIRPKEEIIVDGLVWSKFKHNDTVWTLSEGKLHLSLDKCQETWWDKLFCSEPSIDVKKLDCTRYIDELPQESQAAIHKLRVEEMENKTENTMDSEQMARLKQAWNAEGSPFKGQPFDPSLVKFH